MYRNIYIWKSNATALMVESRVAHPDQWPIRDEFHTGTMSERLFGVFFGILYGDFYETTF